MAPHLGPVAVAVMAAALFFEHLSRVPSQIALPADLRDDYLARGQGHVVDAFDTGGLSDQEKIALISQLKRINLSGTLELHEAAAAPQEPGEVTPLAATRSAHPAGDGDAGRWHAEGLGAVLNGSVAVVTLAGGQGSRLGFDGPKGAYDIRLPSRAPLFELLAQRVAKVEALALQWALESGRPVPPGGPRVPWLVMTSPLNHGQTTRFFESKRWFGLDQAQVHFFRQGVQPPLTPNGRLIMSGRAAVAEAPDGNGGVYAALQSSGELDRLEKAGVQWIHVHSVDNALAVAPDPVLVGFTATANGGAGAEVGCAVVRKTDAAESIGVYAEVDGAVSVLEYSEIPPKLVRATADDGGLAFAAGNICNHVLAMGFVQRAAATSLGYHRAHKKIPRWEWLTQSTVKPAERNGYKLESFIFDSFKLANGVALLEVNRETHFAPVKNAEGHPTDSPDTARAAVLALAERRWRAAGGPPSDVPLELPVALTLAGEGLEWARDAVFDRRGSPSPPRVQTASSVSGGSYDLFGTIAFVCDLLTEGAATSLGVCSGQLRAKRDAPPPARLIQVPSGGGGSYDVSWDPAMLSTMEVGAEETAAAGAGANRVHHSYRGKRISVWHEVPLLLGVDEVDGSPVFNFVCEIPRGVAAKYEIHKSLQHNPIQQDVKCKSGKCTPREYLYPADNPGCPANYGALPQTWENPSVRDEITGYGGDNDPIDVVHVEAPPCTRVGEVRPVRVLGALAMLDKSDGEPQTDWKLIAVDADASARTLADLSAATVPTVREWLRLYKTAEGKPENTFALAGNSTDAATAVAVTMATHNAWRALDGCTFNTPAGGEVKPAPCWREIVV